MVIAVVPPRTLFQENCNRTKCQQFLLKQTSSQRPNSLCVYESRRTKQPSKEMSRFKPTVFAFHLCFITGKCIHWFPWGSTRTTTTILIYLFLDLYLYLSISWPNDVWTNFSRTSHFQNSKSWKHRMCLIA